MNTLRWFFSLRGAKKSPTRIIRVRERLLITYCMDIPLTEKHGASKKNGCTAKKSFFYSFIRAKKTKYITISIIGIC